MKPHSATISILLITTLTLFLNSKVFGQGDIAIFNDYKIEIRAWGMLFDVKWIVSKDSILFFEHDNWKKAVEIFGKSLSIAESSAISNSLSKVNLDSISKENVGDAPDDLPEYDFKLTIDRTIKEFHIYEVRIDSVFNLVKQINEFLPGEYAIGYNDAYLH